MKAIDIVKRRLSIDDVDAKFYVALAEAQVRQSLHLSETDDVSEYFFQIADIAVLSYQRDMSTKNTQSTLGYKSTSFSEGSVSESFQAMDGATIVTTYETKIQDILNSLKRDDDGMVVFI